MPARLLVAYGLIALMVLAALTFAWWVTYNSHSRRDERARERLSKRRRRRDEAAAERASADR